MLKMTVKEGGDSKPYPSLGDVIAWQNSAKLNNYHLPLILLPMYNILDSPSYRYYKTIILVSK